jgi:ABC-type phosphate transport system substrate-binding protein
MRIVHLFLIFIFITATWQPVVWADDGLAVIVAANNSLNKLSVETLKQIYLLKKPMDDEGNRWIPLNLSLEEPLRRRFSQFLFSVSPEEHEEYWNIQYFNGISPPKVVNSEEAVLRFVSVTHGAIGYVRTQKVDNRVKVLLTIP